MKKIFLIDGHAQIFRMYYAFMRHPLINTKGQDTSILFGFTKMVLELINKEHPTNIAVVFDAPGKTFRHTIYKEYKANRPPAPELVIQAFEPLQEILKALNIPVVIVTGVEADDVIGSMAKQWSGSDKQIYMVTPDKDFGQLIQKNVFQYKLPKGGNGDTEVIGTDQLCAHYGIKDPAGVIDILTIWGDTSDNVPGIRGIGEVGAKKLIGKYGTLENVMQHIGELSASIQKHIKESSEEQVKMSRFLVTIKTDIQLPVNEDNIKITLPNEAAVNDVFAKYEFNSLKKMIPGFNNHVAASDDYPEDSPADDFPADDEPEQQADVQHVEEEKTKKFFSIPDVEFCSLDKVATSAKKNKEISILMNGKNSLTLCSTDNFVHIVENLEELQNTQDYPILNELLSEPSICKTGADLKEVIKTVAKKTDIQICGNLYDIQLMHYVLNTEISHNIDFIVKQQLSIDIEGIASNSKEEAKDLFSGAAEETEEQKKEKEKKSATICALMLPLKKELEKKLSGDRVYKEIEMPLIPVLAQVEMTGVKIDNQQLKEYSKELTAQMNEIEQEARKLADDASINLSSPKQIGILLYEKLKLNANVKKSLKGNYSTDETTLNELKDTHPIVEKILEYRNLKKLLSTYIDALPLLINPKTGKVHTTFNQALTSTGRLSSINPNLQNIPVRTERGREIRKAFVPSDPAGCIVSADYSQIELRLMAHMSGDENLIAAFNSGKDVHAATAAKLYNVSVDEVTAEQRRKAKTVNFGIIYGISAFGLAERMEIPIKEAKEFIETYFKTYPGVSRYINATAETARKNEYVETIYGRRRYLKDINSRNANVRKFNERNAVNAPLQGSAADIIKLAMIHVFARMQAEHLKSKMVLQVHDELVFDVVPCEREAVMKIAKEEMESVIKLKVPLTADCSYGENWLQAH
ncbi:MAG TPA: DNA polymerase I [Candidatus Egerieousia sp.]|nr:DNA polymerase I [Candidatus Egerieousia sp.]